MMYREIIVVCSEIHPIQNTEFLYVKTVGVYCKS